MPIPKKSGSITTNLKVKYFILPELSQMKIVMWGFHVDDSSKGIYGMILSRDILTALGLNIKFSNHVIKSDYGPFKGPMAPMVDMGTYAFKYLNTGKISPE